MSQQTDPTIMQQFANSPTLLAILQTFKQAIDPSEDFDNFYNFVFNLATATTYGLDVWGRIVGINRDELKDSSGVPLDLTDDQYRAAIMAKALVNIGTATNLGINAALNYMFGDVGGAYVIDGMNMTNTYEFLFDPDAFQLSMIQYFARQIRPSGVGAMIETESTVTWGFSQQQATEGSAIGNFSQDGTAGPFLPVLVVI